MQKKIILLGATGSIGTSTLQIIRNYPREFKLVGVSANKNIKALVKICHEFQVENATITNFKDLKKNKNDSIFPKTTQVWHNLNDLIDNVAADLAVVAIVGSCALMPTLKAINKGINIALANKELLVLGGSFVVNAAKKNNVKLLPIDSEHNAIFQCTHGYNMKDLHSIILTASGGALRDVPLKKLNSITPEKAVMHPNWSMGKKISIDSATMANKGLELMEARWLFDLKYDQMKVVMHPQSIIHSFVQWIDGSIFAQLTPPSMVFSIQYCLFYPEKKPNINPSIDFNNSLNLDFNKPELNRYPCLALAYDALKIGNIGSVIYNAANEVAVQEFLFKKIKFTDIPKLIEKALNKYEGKNYNSIDDLIELDNEIKQDTKTN